MALTLLGTQYQAELLLGCKQGKPQVLLGLRGQFVGASDPVVWTRLGAAKAEKKRWSLSSNSKAVVLPGDAGLFVRQLLSTDRLTVQMELSLRGPVTDVFNLQGLKDVIHPLNDACALK